MDSGAGVPLSYDLIKKPTGISPPPSAVMCLPRGYPAAGPPVGLQISSTPFISISAQLNLQ
jgi:hypothetical protein